MTDDRDLHVEVIDREIIVTLPYTRYTVTYYKPSKSFGLLAKRFPDRNDPHARLTQADFLAQAWKLASDKARSLGWIM
jgi:hypothetical protein